MRGSGRLSRCVSALAIPDSCSTCATFLSRRGYAAVEVGADEADILVPGAGRSFEAVAMLMSEIGIWRAKQASVQVVLVEPEG